MLDLSPEASASAVLNRSRDRISTKIAASEKRRSIYPYYAGYSEDFVRWLIPKMDLPEGGSILDPWNGAGTTTYVGSCMGFQTTGIDISPVMCLVARARAADENDILAVQRAIAVSAVSCDKPKSPIEQLATAVKQFRRQSAAAGTALPPSAQALVATAAFRAARTCLSVTATRNPTWFKVAANNGTHLTSEEAHTLLIGQLTALISTAAGRDHSIVTKPTIRKANLNTCRLPPAHYDAIITSPPYLTRLDYVKATLPELTLLAHLSSGINPTRLRETMMGSPLVGQHKPRSSANWGKTSLDLLQQIQTHQSKASSGYYLRFYLQYLNRLHRSLAHLLRAAGPKAKIAMVVQPSYYKELYIDLPLITCEMAENLGQLP